MVAEKATHTDSQHALHANKPYVTPEEIMTAAKSVVGNDAHWRQGLAKELGVDVGDINQWIESWDIAPPPAWLRERLATMLKEHAQRCQAYAEYLLCASDLNTSKKTS